MGSILLNYIRPYDEEKDKGLPEYSHSRLECFETCPYQFDLKYNQNKTSTDTNISLEVGSLFHLALEHKGNMLFKGEKVDYDFLNNLIENGGMSDDGKGHEFFIVGVNELKKKYFDVWNEKDSEGRTYEDKLNNFLKILHTEMEEDDGWEPYLFEHPFKYVWKDKIVLHGFIDRVDKRINSNGETEYRVVDYKTSKKIYDTAKTSTSQQMSIYNMALLIEFGTEAAENLYRFICINESQPALTKGWQSRFIKKLDKVLDQIDECRDSKTWKPAPKPLCRWCSFSKTNPDAHAYKNECAYHSNWTPESKDFSVNKEWNPELEQRTKKILFNW